MSTITIELPSGCSVHGKHLTLVNDTATRALRAALSGSLVKQRGGGRKATCTCGTCRKCKVRANVQAYRDRKASERKIVHIEDQITQDDFFYD